jgi:mono/diheme cytochrome c family protein
MVLWVCDDSLQIVCYMRVLERNEFALGARMRSGAVIFLLFAVPLAVPGQQDKISSPVALNDMQILGRRVFQQRCAVCHTESTPGARRYGPVLSKELVDSNEDAIRDFISNGSKGKMPGFKYGLEAPEINAIVEYLKTLPRPAKRGGPTQSQDGMLD